MTKLLFAAVGAALMMTGAASADIIGQQQQQKMQLEIQQLQLQLQKQLQLQLQLQEQANQQITTFEAGRHGFAPSIAVGGYGFGAAIQDCWLVGRGKVGSVGGSVGIASNGITGGGGLFSYGTNYSLMNVVCENTNRIFMAETLEDHDAAKYFKCMDPLWRSAMNYKTPGACDGIQSIETLAIDPEVDSVASALAPVSREVATSPGVQTASVGNSSDGGTCFYSPEGCN